MSEIIYEDSSRGLSMFIDEGYSNDFVDLLKTTIWGTDGLRYLSHGLKEELARIPNFRMIRLLQDEILLGVYGLAEKNISIGDAKIKAIHRMLLAVDQKHLGQGFGKLLVEQTKHHFLDMKNDAVMLYGYIEEQNSRSLGLSKKAGYQNIGTFQSVLFNRFRPQPNSAIEQPVDKDELRSLLEEHYAEFALCDIEQSLIPSEYYLVRRSGVIVAGLQAHRKCYSIVDLGGWYGGLLLRGLPKMPFLRRLLPNGNLEFLLVSNIYVAPGFEDDFCNLLEGILSLYELHVAMAFLDINSPVLERLQAKGGFGVLSKLGVESFVHVMAGFNQITDEIISDFSQRSLFISPLDPV